MCVDEGGVKDFAILMHFTQQTTTIKSVATAGKVAQKKLYNLIVQQTNVDVQQTCLIAQQTSLIVLQTSLIVLQISLIVPQKNKVNVKKNQQSLWSANKRLR